MQAMRNITPVRNERRARTRFIASIIFLKEKFTIATIGGALMIIAGVIVMNLKFS